MQTKNEKAAHTQVRIHPAMRSFMGYCMYKVALRMRACMDKRMEAYGLVAPQCGIMSLISKVGPMTQVELGSYMDIDKATMVRFLDGLEKRKFLTRTADLKDRRAKVLQLTSSGKKILDIILKIRNEVEQEVFAPLSKKELETLHGLISKVAIQD